MRIPDPIRPYLTIAVWVLALVLLAALAIGAARWDKARIEAARLAGANEERAAWTSGQRQADQAQRDARNASDAASFQASDTMREGIAADRSATQEATQVTVDIITKESANAPLPICRPDGRPGPLPVGVLDALDAARGRAVGASGSAKG